VLNNVLEIENKIRERLSRAIKTSVLSLRQIAQQVGISIATVSYYKNMEKLPTVPTLAILCRVLDLSSDELLGLK